MTLWLDKLTVKETIGSVFYNKNINFTVTHVDSSPEGVEQFKIVFDTNEVSPIKANDLYRIKEYLSALRMDNLS